MAEKYQVSLFVGMNHIPQYGSADDYVLGENDFPVTPAHTPPNFGIRLDLRYVMIFAEPDSISSMNGVVGITYSF